MANGNNIKFYKNPSRNEAESHEIYVPQYQEMGIEPSLVDFAKSETAVDNPRNKKIGISVPINNNIKVPNVGNNMENTWSSVNEDMIDYDLDPNHPIIDNNNFISNETLDKPSSNESVGTDLFSLLKNVKEGDYVLFLNGIAVCSGPMEDVQEQAKSLVFGQHELCDGQPIPIDDVLILKKAVIKIGLFLE